MDLYSRTGARRALFHTFGFRAISQLATVFSFVVLVRGLSEQAVGVFNLLYSVIPVIGTVASLGLDPVLKRFQPEYLRAGNTAAAAWLTRLVTRLRFISNLVVLAAIVLAWNFVAPLFHLTSHLVDFELFGIVVLLYFQTMILQSSLASHMLHRYSVGSIAVLSVGKLLSYLALTEFFSFTLRAAILADTMSYLLAYIFLLVAHSRMCRTKAEDRRYRPNPSERKRLRRYALANNFNDSSSLLLYVQTDNFFIAALMNPIAVGAYSSYARINEMAANLIPAKLFENVVQPMLFATKADQAAERLPRYFTFLVNINMLVQWPLMAFTTVYHHEIVQIVFHGKFIEYSSLLPVIVAFAFTNNVISTPITMMALYAENAGLILKSQLFGLYQVAAMLVLIPFAGLYGAAIATGTLHLFRNLWVWWKVGPMGRWTNFRAAVTTGLLIWGSVVAICFALKAALNLSPLVSMALGLGVCTLANLAFIRSPAISKSDREILGGVLHGREATVLRFIGMLPPRTNENAAQA
jgi:O-antigen/teichoic acid export membrane protein